MWQISNQLAFCDYEFIYYLDQKTMMQYNTLQAWLHYWVVIRRAEQILRNEFQDDEAWFGNWCFWFCWLEVYNTIAKKEGNVKHNQKIESVSYNNFMSERILAPGTVFK